MIFPGDNLVLLRDNWPCVCRNALLKEEYLLLDLTYVSISFYSYNLIFIQLIHLKYIKTIFWFWDIWPHRNSHCNAFAYINFLLEVTMNSLQCACRLMIKIVHFGKCQSWIFLRKISIWCNIPWGQLSSRTRHLTFCASQCIFMRRLLSIFETLGKVLSVQSSGDFGQEVSQITVGGLNCRSGFLLQYNLTSFFS